MIKSMALGLAAFAALAATNPREDEHARHIVTHSQGRCGDGLGKLMCGGMTVLASAGLEYRDHVVFSTARLGDTETVGALGTVVVLD